MSRYTGPKFKLSRRLGISLSGTGKELKRPYPPGQHGPGQRRKISGYGEQLKEKQKLRHMYGLSEKQFRNLFNKASKMKGIAGENFMILLESRLDNLVYRLGWANSRAGARQLVAHGHITVNGKKVDIPSYQVSPGDVIGLREKAAILKLSRRHWKIAILCLITWNTTNKKWKANTSDCLNARSCRLKFRNNKSSSFTAVNMCFTGHALACMEGRGIPVPESPFHDRKPIYNSQKCGKLTDHHFGKLSLAYLYNIPVLNFEYGLDIRHPFSIYPDRPLRDAPPRFSVG